MAPLPEPGGTERTDHRDGAVASMVVGLCVLAGAAAGAAALRRAGVMATPVVPIAIPGVIMLVYGFRGATGRTGPGRSARREAERARRAVEAVLGRPVLAAGWFNVDLATAPPALASSLGSLPLRSIPASYRGSLRDPRSIVLAVTDATMDICGAQYASVTAAIQAYPVAELPLAGLEVTVDPRPTLPGCHRWTIRALGVKPLVVIAPGMHGVQENAPLLAALGG
jgi:hypothetical protein